MSLIFFILSIMNLFFTIFYQVFKKKIHSLVILKSIILSLFGVTTSFFVYEVIYFIKVDSKYILENFNKNIELITSFNLSILFFGISIILYLSNYIHLNENRIRLNSPSYHDSKKGSIRIGKVIKNSSKKYSFLLSLKDLEKHMFICGSTGTGKSNFLQNFLINFTNQFDIPFFLVEFKGEYHFLQERIRDTIILWPGENFSLNIFDPVGTNPIIHAERIFNILKSGKFIDDSSAEYSPQMEKVLIEILKKVCEDENLRNWKGFENCCGIFLKENQNSIPMLKQTLIGIQNRIRRFSIGPLRRLFESHNIISIQNIFNKNIILDLSSIIRLGGEKEDALFFLNMILKYLWDKNLTKGAFNYKGIQHLTIIEDAQYFAPQDLTRKWKLTTYLEDIALLQRGTGECLITLATRPDISKEILANCGVLVSFQSHMQKDLMQELLNLDSEDKNYLSALDEGQCIIRVNSIKDPFFLWIPYIKRHYLTVSKIQDKNMQILKNFIKDNNQNLEKIKKRTKQLKYCLIFDKIKCYFKKFSLKSKMGALDVKYSNDNEKTENESNSSKEISDQEIFQEYINNLYGSQMNNK